MEIEVLMPAPASPATAAEFNFDSTCSTPYITAPSTPQRLAVNLTAAADAGGGGGVPFQWEEKPGTPKRNGTCRSKSTEFFEDDDFEFDFSGQLSRSSLSAADELFYGGKIRPLKPPPGYESSITSPRSPKSPKSNSKLLKKEFEFDPFQAAIDETRNRDEKQELDQRGRERSSSNSFNYDPGFNSHSGGRRGISRSMSPLRVSDEMLVDDDVAAATSSGKQSYAAAFLAAISFSKGRPYKKWKLRDLLLFRSASEGRATSFRSSEMKYAVLSRRSESVAAAEDAKTSSFRSTESIGSSRRMRAAVSAHEMHYTTNRAAAEEMRRKTFLPYKQGLLGCLGFSPGGVSDISSRGVGSLTRG
ncbi:hypothetical protein LINPERPRIM_LOCUS16637 [Linum perenne]